MANLPRHKTSTLTVHEWIIGDGTHPLYARDLRDGIFFAQKDMEAMGIDVGTDDAYQVIGDMYEITLRVEVEE